MLNTTLRSATCATTTSTDTTTTTSTTTASNCFSFTIRKSSIGVVAVTYTNCSGVASSINIGNPTPGGPSEATFCARNGSITVPPDVSLINNGSC